jgi:hypothetical protein
MATQEIAIVIQQVKQAAALQPGKRAKEQQSQDSVTQGLHSNFMFA